jgi:hypothetical protein
VRSREAFLVPHAGGAGRKGSIGVYVRHKCERPWRGGATLNELVRNYNIGISIIGRQYDHHGRVQSATLLRACHPADRLAVFLPLFPDWRRSVVRPGAREYDRIAPGSAVPR